MDHQYTIIDDNDLEYNPDQDEVLIELVQAQPHLYDKKDKNFKDVTLKNNSWMEISKATAMPVEECMNRWHRLRERYAKYSKDNAKAESLGTEMKFFPFYEKLAFLTPHIKRRRRYECRIIPSRTPIASKNTKQPVTYLAYDVTPNVSTPTIISSGTQLMTLGGNYVVSSVVPKKKQDIKSVAVLSKQSESNRVKREMNNAHTEEVHLVPNKVIRYDDGDSTNSNDVLIEESDPLSCDNTLKTTSVRNVNRTMDSTDYFSLFISEELKKLPEDERKEKKKKIFAILME